MPKTETFGTNNPPVGISSSRNIVHAHPILQEAWPKIKERFFEETGYDLFLTCTWRSVAEQKRLYAQGRTAPGKIVTWVDGVTKRSLHNLYPARAIDVCVDQDTDVTKVKVSWDWWDYKPLIGIAAEFNLVSGGSWKRKDWPHLEIS